MKPDKETPQSNPAQGETQVPKEQEEQGKKNWKPKSKNEIRLLEKMGMRIRVQSYDSRSELDKKEED